MDAVRLGEVWPHNTYFLLSQKRKLVTLEQLPRACAAENGNPASLCQIDPGGKIIPARNLENMHLERRLIIFAIIFLE